MCKTIKCQEENGKAKKVGGITEWFNRPKAGVAKLEEITLSVGDRFFLINENISWCQLATVENIQINDKSEEKIQTNMKMEIGLKFDKTLDKDCICTLLNKKNLV